MEEGKLGERKAKRQASSELPQCTCNEKRRMREKVLRLVGQVRKQEKQLDQLYGLRDQATQEWASYEEASDVDEAPKEA